MSIINYRVATRNIMNNQRLRKLMVTLLCVCLLIPYTICGAHSGRTDAYGGHHDYRNVSGLGSYHYHCGGHPAHLHPNGVCPYSSTATTHKTVTKVSKYYKASTVRAVQKKLNKKGFHCGRQISIHLPAFSFAAIISLMDSLTFSLFIKFFCFLMIIPLYHLFYVIVIW